MRLPGFIRLRALGEGGTPVSRTTGAVSDAEAQLWASAANWDSGCIKWAEANGQPGFLPRMTGPTVINRSEDAALAQAATITLPACDLFPPTCRLFSVDANG